MSWAEEVAATYRDAGTAENVIFTPAAGGTARTYADCQVVGRTIRAVQEGGVVTSGSYQEISVPRVSGAQKPAAGEFVAPATSGGVFSVQKVQQLPGCWIVEAA